MVKVPKIKLIVVFLLPLLLASCCCPWDPRCKFNIHFDDKYGNNPWDPRPDTKKEEKKERRKDN